MIGLHVADSVHFLPEISSCDDHCFAVVVFISLVFF
jgi:hypothetical protein